MNIILNVAVCSDLPTIIGILDVWLVVVGVSFQRSAINRVDGYMLDDHFFRLRDNNTLSILDRLEHNKLVLVGEWVGRDWACAHE